MRPIPPIAGVPEELLVVLNDRLREIAAPQSATEGAAVLPNVGTKGTYTKVTTDAQGRVISGGRLQTSDLPGGGYPTVPDNTIHDQFYSARSSSIGTVNTAVPAAGRYLFAYNVGTTTGGAGTVTLTFQWTSNGTGRTITVGPLNLTAAANQSQTYVFNADASTNISYGVTYAATGAYEFTAVIVKL